MIKSWYPKPELTPEQIKYLKLIQSIFKVNALNKKWVPYILTPHQQEFHAQDIAILGSNAKNRCVIKSRNTSFTTSAIISNLMAVYNYPDQVIPYVRLNAMRAKDLIREEKKIISHMTPIKLPNGDLYPFDPDKCNMDSEMRIIFPNGTEHRAFPATNSASESIRGLRINGSAGIIDESNFMKDFENIYVACRDSSAGSDFEGSMEFQMNIGTTLKGAATPFKLWYDKVNKQKDTPIQLYKWPVFDLNIYDREIPITEQELIPIVPWHSLETLEKKRIEDEDRFAEEYLAVPVDSEKQFYPSSKIMSCINTELKNMKYIFEQGEYYGGVDVASVNDYFAIVIFQKVEDRFIQRYLYYNRKVDLEDMEKLCKDVVFQWKEFGLKKFRIDANGQGFQIAQTLKKIYPDIVEGIRGNLGINTGGSQKIPLKEFLHTNLKKYIVKGNITLLNDDLQYVHYCGYNYNFECDSTKEYGHGDIVSATTLALLPLDFKKLNSGEDMAIGSVRTINESNKIREVEPETMIDKLKRLRRQGGWG